MNYRRISGAATVISILFAIMLLWPTGRYTQAGSPAKRLTIICSNDTEGNIEPCGCGGQNSGGLPRRATFIKQARAENPNLIAVESGNLAVRLALERETLQLETVAEALKTMGYAAVGVGSTDRAMGDLYYNVLKDKGLTVVHIGAPENSGAQPYVIKSIDGIRVGIISYGSTPSHEAESPQLLELRNQAYFEVRAKSDILVVLDQAGVCTDDWIGNITKTYGAPDLVVDGNRNISLSQARMVGSTMIIPTAYRASTIGKVDVTIDSTGKKLMTFTRITLDEKFKDDPDILKLVKDYGVRQKTLRAAAFAQSVGLQSGSTTTPDLVAIQPYYSHLSCIECHPAAYERWKNTGHARAFATLESKEKTLIECLPCHSESFRRGGETVSGDGGVECGSCHYNVLPHGPDYKAAEGNRSAIRSFCAECHTKERSPQFVLEKAYQSIKHK